KNPREVVMRLDEIRLDRQGLLKLSHCLVHLPPLAEYTTDVVVGLRGIRLEFQSGLELAKRFVNLALGEQLDTEAALSFCTTRKARQQVERHRTRQQRTPTPAEGTPPERLVGHRA